MELVCSGYSCSPSRLNESILVDEKVCCDRYTKVRNSWREGFCVRAAVPRLERTVACGSEVIVIVRQAGAVRELVKERGCNLPDEPSSFHSLHSHIAPVPPRA
jgi:hypothetical protein